MDNRERAEEARLEEIRRRARETRVQELEREHEQEREHAPQEERIDRSEPRSRRSDRGPHVSTWQSPVHRERHGGYSGPLGRGPRETWSPRARVFDRDGALIVRIDLPGIERKDVEVRVEDQMLIVEGERPDDRPESGGFDPRSRWGYGPFRSEVALPRPVDASDVKARFRNGVLEVAVPQPRREERRRTIKLET